MKALSIQQPWAHLIANGHKDIENRDWNTSYRGIVLIHAGKRFDTTCFIGDRLVTGPAWAYTDGLPQWKKEYELGGIIGYATLQKVVTESDSPWFRGKYGFVFTQRRTVPFIPLRGQLYLFDVPAEIEDQINEIRDRHGWEADMKNMQQIKREWEEYRLG